MLRLLGIPPQDLQLGRGMIESAQETISDLPDICGPVHCAGLWMQMLVMIVK